MMGYIRLISFVFLAFLFSGCGSDEQKEYSVAKAKPKGAHKHVPGDNHKHQDEKKSADKGTEEVSSEVISYTWSAPKTWVEKKLSSMRKGSYEIKEGDAVGDLSITEFPGEVGGLLNNVNRWRNQVGLDLIDQKALSGLGDKIKTGLGEAIVYLFVNPKSDKNGFLVCHHPLKSSTLFIKLSMNPKSLSKVKSEFTLFCQSLKLKEKEGAKDAD